MDWNFILLFFVIQLINVVLNTVRSVITIKGGKVAATIITAICYGFYTIVVVYTAADYDLWAKVALTVITNIIGTYFSLLMLEKLKKDKTWRIEARTFADVEDVDNAVSELVTLNYCFTLDQPWHIDNQPNVFIITVYADSQKDSITIKKILDSLEPKYVVFEQDARL